MEIAGQVIFLWYNLKLKQAGRKTESEREEGNKAYFFIS